ncbi:MAG: hypothetical protein ABIV92_01375, partial [Thermoflexales bacterium]
PPASLSGTSYRPSGPEAFVLSDGAFQAPVGLLALLVDSRFRGNDIPWGFAVATVLSGRLPPS